VKGSIGEKRWAEDVDFVAGIVERKGRNRKLVRPGQREMSQEAGGLARGSNGVRVDN